jgi:hypothetical protein
MPRGLKIHGAIVGLALLIFVPALFFAPMLRDSFWIDWVWSDQFTAELAKGHLYPRWLPLSNGGQGSPAFYFYPPIAFYVSGVLGLIGLSTYHAILACFAIALTLSGYTMFAWLRDTPHPLLGALIFMAAPYHVFDFYSRGAQAEFLAIAILPLVALGLRRARESRPMLLAYSYAALILTHLPLAVLTSLFLIGPYCLWKGPRRLLVPLALGIAMGAIFLVPALALNHYRLTAWLWGTQFQPKNWSLIFPHEGPVEGMRIVFAAIIVVTLVPIVILWFAGQKYAARYAAVCCFLAAGVVPAFWTLPLLKEVQFPFRLMPLIEFAIATGLASVRLSGPLWLLAMSPQLMLTPVFVFLHSQERAPKLEWLIFFHPDVPENHLTNPSQPLPKWPEQLGLAISLIGLAGAGALAVRQRRRLTTPEPAGSAAPRGTGGASRPRAGRGRRRSA